MTDAIDARDLAALDAFVAPDVLRHSGDYVAVRARYIGIQDGPMGPFPASGNRH
jgi:hypothetical protein